MALTVQLSVVFDANGGSGAPGAGGVTENYNGGTQTLSYSIPSKVPSRDNYTFLGWSTNKNATTASYFPAGWGGTTSYSHTFTSFGTYTVYLYAVWSQNTYTVSYNKGTYGSGTNSTDTKIHGVNLTLKTRQFTRPGYIQKAWSTYASGSNWAYNLGGTYSTNANITLYPYWEPVSSVHVATSSGLDTYTIYVVNSSGGLDKYNAYVVNSSGGLDLYY